MQEPATASWGLRISNTDFEKLKAGLQPQDQDDKWHVYISNKEQSTISIHVARSAFNIEVYVLHIVIKPDDDIDSDNGSIVEIASITWETNINGYRVFEEQAKKEVVMITRSNLECDFDALPEYDPDDMWDYRTADSSNIVPPRGTN
jgi:hypothetical protein